MFLVILSPQLRSGEDGYSWLEMAVFPLTHGGLDLTGIGYFPDVEEHGNATGVIIINP